ncbi:hypothetical protein INT45_001519 [Circinella minor]|uniref:Uncharacterized protein n=1 Tax=Circinella minor TaxID=1195481 RepID=A0A8H7S9E2_9FUNG|nr:hypothetical protein INT45_001519 [Circinella minor]
MIRFVSSTSLSSLKSHLESFTEASEQDYAEGTGWDFPQEESPNTSIWNQEKSQVIPELIVEQNGNILFRQYDSDFVPPLKFTDIEELYSEGGLYFDLVHEVVNLKMARLKLLHKILTRRENFLQTVSRTEYCRFCGNRKMIKDAKNSFTTTPPRFISMILISLVTMDCIFI